MNAIVHDDWRGDGVIDHQFQDRQTIKWITELSGIGSQTCVNRPERGNELMPPSFLSSMFVQLLDDVFQFSGKHNLILSWLTISLLHPGGLSSIWRWASSNSWRKSSM